MLNKLRQLLINHQLKTLKAKTELKQYFISLNIIKLFIIYQQQIEVIKETKHTSFSKQFYEEYLVDYKLKIRFQN